MAKNKKKAVDLNNPDTVPRAMKLTLIYRWTHKDFKASPGHVRHIMINRNGGAKLVPLESLTDEEVAQRIEFALQKERDRRLRLSLTPGGKKDADDE